MKFIGYIHYTGIVMNMNDNLTLSMDQLIVT